jgi:predicted outer membrane repeat protein
MNAFNLSGNKILVTGASSGIGKQAAITISQNGAIVYIIGRNKQRLDETLKELKGNHHQSIVADLSDHNEIDTLIDKLPELNGVVHSAGIANLLPAKFIQPENISQMFKINYEAPVLITGKLLKKKKLKNNASIVFISSLATKDPIIGGALYGSTKGAIEAYSKVLCVELASRGIRSNCISPAYVKTVMIDFIQKEEMEKYEKIYPLGFGEAIDVAHAIVFFLSDASRWISGANLTMGGG